MRSFIFSILIGCFYATLSHAQYTVHGNVTDEYNLPLSSVSVTVGNNLLTVTSDSAGNYSFPFSLLGFDLAFTHVGYKPVIIKNPGASIPMIILYANTIFLSETAVQSFERNGSIKNLPAAVSILNRSSLERFGSSSFIPAINTVPGVKMDERSPGSYRLSIRGNLLRSTFGVRNVKVYWNGIPFTDANGNTYINEIAFDNIDKAEILKGPSGSMYGSGTGGVLLLNSRFNTDRKSSLVFKTGGGSYGLYTAGASYDQSGTVMKSHSSFSHQQSDGYRTHSNMRKDVANFTGTYFINTKQSILTNIFYSDLYYKTPGGLTMAEMTVYPRMARPAAGIFKSAQAQKAALYLKTIYAGFANDLRFNNQWSNITSVYFSNTDFKNPTIRNFEIKSENGFGARSVTKYTKDIFTGIFGGEYQYGFSNTSTFGNDLGMKDSLQYHDKINSRQVNIFLQADVSLAENLILNAGISYNDFHYGFQRVSDPVTQKENSNFSPQFIPRISLLKKIWRVVSLYASVSKGYSPPSIDEVHAGDGNFNKALNAEYGINYEAGFKADLFKNKLSIDAAYYLFGLQNTIVSRRDAAGADYFVNAGRTNQRGFEIATAFLPVNDNTRFLTQLKAWINYTNIHARFVHYEQGTAKYDGNKLTGTPPNVFIAGVDLTSTIGLYLNVTYNFTDEIPLNDANSFSAHHYNLFYTKLGFKKAIGKKVTGDIFSAFDHSFNQPFSLGNDLNAAGNRFFNPSSPTNFYGGIRMKVNL
ncbi:MAG: TonB-dependent receptor [Ferruginibacter sp.]